MTTEQTYDHCPECGSQHPLRIIGNNRTVTAQCACGQVYSLERRVRGRVSDYEAASLAWERTRKGSWRWWS